ncbi:hypothetical protein BGZ76_008846 [Entomortierella beljakovae]|nr:hypothetical protein BGZ76_008846 [Entomortierella beljakovae]
MDHGGGHGGHDGGHDGGEGTCSMNMLFNWSTENLCVVFESWKINSPAALIFSCIIIIGMAASYEALRAQSRCFEERLVEGAKKRTAVETFDHNVGGSTLGDETPLLPSRLNTIR